MPIQRIPWERHPFGEGSLRDEVKDKVQTTIEREPDFLKRVIDHKGKEFPEGIPLVYTAVGVSDYERPRR